MRDDQKRLSVACFDAFKDSTRDFTFHPDGRALLIII